MTTTYKDMVNWAYALCASLGLAEPSEELILEILLPAEEFEGICLAGSSLTLAQICAITPGCNPWSDEWEGRYRPDLG